MRKTKTRSHGFAIVLAALIAFTLSGCGTGFNNKLDQSSTAGRTGSPTGGSDGSGTGAGPGSATGPGPGSGSGSGTISNSPSTTAKFACTQPTQSGQADKTRRLTKQEIVGSLNAILGSGVVSAANAEVNAIPEDSTQNLVREFSSNHSMAHLTAMMELGLKLGSNIESNTTLKRKYASCWPTSGAPADACIKTFISGLGLRFYRRPLTTDEVTFYFDAYKKFGSTPVRGLLTLFVQAPNFLFQIEEGTGTTNGARVRLSDYEIASRLAFRLTGTSPDDELYAAAGRGELGAQAGLETQAQRLLATPQGEARIQHFFSEYANLRKVPQVSGVLPDLPDSNVSALRQDMINEYQSLISQVVVKGNADFKQLFTTPLVFPQTSRLASVYGSSVWDGSSQAPSSTQGHRGLLMRAALLASGNLETNIIARGVRVRREILCDTLLSPPLDVIQSRNQETAGYTPEKYSNRQLVEHKTSPVSCAGCHSQINPVGFVLEAYNQFGMKRSLQSTLDSTGRIIASFPIDTRVSEANIEPGASGAVLDATELITSVANGYKARACMSQRLFEFARLRPFSATDNCSIAEIESSLIAGGSVKNAFFKSVVNQEIFWKTAVQ